MKFFLEKEETLIEKRRHFVRRFSVSSGTDVLSENVSQPTFQDRKREREQLHLSTAFVNYFSLYIHFINLKKKNLQIFFF